MDILIEPVKTILEKAAEAASSLLRSSDPNGIDHVIEIKEIVHDKLHVLQVRYNGKVVYQRQLEITDVDDQLDASAVVYGSFLTEMIATFAIVSSESKKRKGG
jgi:hypothetical protein